MRSIEFGVRRFAAVRIIPLLALAALTACGGAAPQGPAVEVEEPWARPARVTAGEAAQMESHGQDGHGGGHHHGAGATSAIYMILRNDGSEADRLVAARSDVANAVELHRSEVVDGVMRMRQVEAIEVPARGEERLVPGGYHIMLIGLTRDLAVGEEIEVELEFEKSGVKTIEVEVAVR